MQPDKHEKSNTDDFLTAMFLYMALGTAAVMGIHVYAGYAVDKQNAALNEMPAATPITLADAYCSGHATGEIVVAPYKNAHVRIRCP